MEVIHTHVWEFPTDARGFVPCPVCNRRMCDHTFPERQDEVCSCGARRVEVDEDRRRMNVAVAGLQEILTQGRAALPFLKLRAEEAAADYHEIVDQVRAAEVLLANPPEE